MKLQRKLGGRTFFSALGRPAAKNAERGGEEKGGEAQYRNGRRFKMPRCQEKAMR